MRMDKGVPYVSDSMYSMTLLALLGALEITVRAFLRFYCLLDVASRYLLSSRRKVPTPY